MSTLCLQSPIPPLPPLFLPHKIVPGSGRGHTMTFSILDVEVLTALHLPVQAERKSPPPPLGIASPRPKHQQQLAVAQDQNFGRS